MESTDGSPQNPDLARLLDRHRPQGPVETADHQRARRLADVTDPADAWSRSTFPLHFTASALIVHPPTRRVLLRWHVRQQAWLHVGGHGDPGETLPLDIALREGREETGLTDLTPWPDAALVHLAVVPVPASPVEPAHEHADLRFLLATGTPDRARPENPASPLEWLTVEEARQRTTEENLRQTLDRAARLLPPA
ncbi:8-oxo-dGTP pyrophosphatase MutT (NUDIX family) [Streptomyces sp. 1114.5]|uniref:NUDIX hydrolase n=1 Tax=Streptomyces sp. 1114.5 TaxID=1938830 RepID=UPI000EAE8D33|nr:NUDIX domain-containing protein [Streptomyces sp. 1114.5]RKT17764.1 8-oxo-dGTP pyrophosphatase MutT (NUDIX family) [Streptomyces sp. 1114.5]